MRVTLSVRPPAALDGADWDAIWLLSARYVDTSREYLESRLREHSEIAIFRTPASVVGIAAIDIDATTFNGARSLIIFTSCVVIDEKYRGRALLQRAGMLTYWRTRLRYPLARIYWMFDTFSYRSYLLLARHFTEFWPRHDRPTPAPVAAFIDHLGRERYGEKWMPDRGVVRRSEQKKLRPHTAAITPRMLADPNVRFFTDANPGHDEGDMLVCLCPLTMSNWANAMLASARFLVSRLGRRGGAGDPSCARDELKKA